MIIIISIFALILTNICLLDILALIPPDFDKRQSLKCQDKMQIDPKCYDIRQYFYQKG
jgi:hypothetical protein